MLSPSIFFNFEIGEPVMISPTPQINSDDFYMFTPEMRKHLGDTFKVKERYWNSEFGATYLLDIDVEGQHWFFYEKWLIPVADSFNNLEDFFKE